LHRVQARTPGYIVTPNVNHVCLLQRDAAFREAYTSAFLALPDGVPIMWAARLFGRPLPQKLSGSDLVPELTAFAAQSGMSVYFLGGLPGSAEKAVARLQQQHPALQVAGVYCPPFGFERDPDALELTLARVDAAKPDLCFIALGSPKQELFMHRYHRRMGATVCVGVGAAFDMLSGRVQRAPRWLQASGMEWLWRLAQEPRRLWRRYLVEDTLFFRLLWREWLRQRRARLPERAEDHRR